MSSFRQQKALSYEKRVQKTLMKLNPVLLRSFEYEMRIEEICLRKEV